MPNNSSKVTRKGINYQESGNNARGLGKTTPISHLKTNFAPTSPIYGMKAHKYTPVSMIAPTNSHI